MHFYGMVVQLRSSSVRRSDNGHETAFHFLADPVEFKAFHDPIRFRPLHLRDHDPRRRAEGGAAGVDRDGGHQGPLCRGGGPFFLLVRGLRRDFDKFENQRTRATMNIDERKNRTSKTAVVAAFRVRFNVFLVRICVRRILPREAVNRIPVAECGEPLVIRSCSARRGPQPRPAPSRDARRRFCQLPRRMVAFLLRRPSLGRLPQEAAGNLRCNNNSHHQKLKFAKGNDEARGKTLPHHHRPDSDRAGGGVRHGDDGRDGSLAGSRSRSRRRRLAARPPPYPPRPPSAAMTRWHGTRMETGLRALAPATARVAEGLPMRRASSPQTIVSP